MSRGSRLTARGGVEDGTSGRSGSIHHDLARPPEVPLRPQSATTTITRAVTVAAGVFAPGHLGELTQYLPFELVDDILEQTRTVQRRLRDLPSRVGVYFVLALGMFPRLGYARVWGKLTAGLAGLPVPRPSEKALRDLRRRLGPAPLKALFEVVAGPLAQPGTPGVRFAGLRTVAFDGLNSLKVPDTGRNRSWLGKIRYRMGLAGYPTLRLMALAETGTRGLLGAAMGSAADRDEAAAGPPAAAPAAPGHARPAGPGLRRQRVPARGRRHRRAAAGARASPPATRLSWATCPTAPTCRSWTGCRSGSSRPRLTVTGADGSRRPGRLPADHHADGPPPVPGRRGGPALSRAVGATRSRLERVELAEGGPAYVGDVVPGPVRKDRSRPGVRRG